MAAQSDVELRDAMAAYLTERDLGPHRGVRAVAEYLGAEQRAERISPHVDVDAVAMLLVSSCFARVGQRHIMGHGDTLPPAKQILDAIMAMLHPAP